VQRGYHGLPTTRKKRLARAKSGGQPVKG